MNLLQNYSMRIILCELDQWLEDYLEEMELQQEEEGEQSQGVSDENNISSLFDMCHYSDISSVEDENSPSSGQCEDGIRMKKNKMIMEIIFTILVTVYFAVEVSFMESKEEILVQNL